jgi:D-alanyl-D-alanine carboxypeptidase
VEHVQEVTGISSGIRLVDGSGLSYQDRVAPKVFVSYLAKFPTTAAGRNFTQLLPANGMGTLRNLTSGFPGAGVVRAKTGTLNNVATVVGYLGRPDGVLLLSLMYNGPQTWSARQEQWKLFRRLGADGVVIDADTFAPEPQFGSDDEAPPDRPMEWWPLPGGGS